MTQFVKLCHRLLALAGVQTVEQTLLLPLVDRVTYHFLGDTATNHVDNPEWLFNFVSTSLSLHVDFLVSTLKDFPIAELTKLQHAFVDSLCAVVRDRTACDLEWIASTHSKQEEDLFEHYVDEVLLFDAAMSELFVVHSPVNDVVVHKYSDKWVEVEKRYMETEVRRLLRFDSWSMREIVGNKFNNLRAAILLYNSTVARCLGLSHESMRSRLTHEVQAWFFPQVVLQHEEAFNAFEQLVLQVESNVELWRKLCMKLCGIHQDLVSPQQFILSLNL